MAEEDAKKHGRSVVPNSRQIVLLRSEKAWTQDKLAKKAGLSKRTIEKVETGKSVNLNTIHIIAERLGVAAGDLIVKSQSAATAEGVAEYSQPMWTLEAPSALQPAPHFAGRKKILDGLRSWIRDPNSVTRVWSLVAVGGTGKTAIAEQLVREHAGEQPFGVFVWSFYENDQVEGFLREAVRYFTGEEDVRSGELAYRLRDSLSGSIPHLLVLDGLERVQAEQFGSRQRGELEDPTLKRFIRWAAAGHNTSVKILLTSRFPITDLAAWEADNRHQVTELDDLDPDSAVMVLRGWGVKGDDDTLRHLAEPLHFHALSDSVLGSYLGQMCGGDPTQAPSLDAGTSATANDKARKLNGILSEYARKLSVTEREMLARLATFPRGVTVEFLRFLANAGESVAGTLKGYTPAMIQTVLHQLRQLGLVFQSKGTFSAHPFLRDFFAGLLGIGSDELNEAIRRQLAPNLASRPTHRPVSPEVLNRYETLIVHTIGARRYAEAYSLYQSALGGFEHLSDIGENILGNRIVSRFGGDGNFPLELSSVRREELMNDWGQFSLSLGDLVSAEAAFKKELQLCREINSMVDESIVHQSLVAMYVLAGNFHLASESVRYAHLAAKSANNFEQMIQSTFDEAMIAAWRGKITTFNKKLNAAKMKGYTPIHTQSGHWYEEILFFLGRSSEAIAHAITNRTLCQMNRWYRDVAVCDAQLARFLAKSDLEQSRECLAKAQEFCARSGEVELMLLCDLSAAAIAMSSGDVSGAIEICSSGIQQAGAHGYNKSQADLQVSLGYAWLRAGDWDESILAGQLAEKLSISGSYSFGLAEGRILQGISLAKMGDRRGGIRELQSALGVMKEMHYPRRSDVFGILKEIRG